MRKVVPIHSWEFPYQWTPSHSWPVRLPCLWAGWGAGWGGVDMKMVVPISRWPIVSQSTLLGSWPVRLPCLPVCLMQWETLLVIYYRLTDFQRSTCNRWLLHLLCLSEGNNITGHLPHRVDWLQLVIFQTGWPFLYGLPILCYVVGHVTGHLL